jgi:predicted TIM-barrel fold metal-dependent hydrolase
MKTLLKLAVVLGTAATALVSCQSNTTEQTEPDFVSQLKLVDYRPKSVFKIPQSDIRQAKYPVIDMHSHPYIDNVEELQEWTKRMEENNIEKVVIQTYAFGDKFDALYDMYKGVSDKFELWCGIDLSSWGTSDFPAKAIEELERCWRKGAKGVGELIDKGLGDRESSKIKQPGLHFNDDLFVPIFSKCAELKMPVTCHVGDPIWMYEELDEKNDGYMNAAEWKIDMTKPGILGLYEVVATLEEACRKNPQTTFIGCHFMNLGHDYEYLGKILDRTPNLYLDNSARHLETCVTPRATKKFYEKYADRIMFGTDNNPSTDMYRLQWRILESEDEHFYARNQTYHWPLHGIGLSNEVLKKVYGDNSRKLYKKLGK